MRKNAYCDANDVAITTQLIVSKTSFAGAVWPAHLRARSADMDHTHPRDLWWSTYASR